MSVFEKAVNRFNLTDYHEDSLSKRLLEIREEYEDNFRYDECFDPDIVIAPSFGQGLTEDSYNQTIAENLLAARNEYGDIPIVAQAEVRKRLEEMPEIDEEDVYRVFEDSGEAEFISDYSTAEVLEKADEILESKDFEGEILYTGHNAHIERILYTAEKLDREGRPLIRDKVEWPEDDGQSWVRSSESWRKRELISRGHHWTYFNVPGGDKVLKKLGL